MKSKNKSPVIFNKTVLKETSAQVDMWMEDIDKIISLSENIAEVKESVILEIALETVMSDFISDIEDGPCNLEEGESGLLVEALSERLQKHISDLVSNHGVKSEDTLSALTFLSKKGQLYEIKKYLENIRADLEGLMKG